LKRVLIISPHFPPVNTADMHRVRQSLPYFKELGWEPVVLAVEESFVEAYSTDPLLLKTIPEDIEVHKVAAWDVKKTRKYGLGSLSMRSYFQFKKKGNELLSQRKFDLVYFSTTAFHVMALGPGWKRKFNVPFILDIQDPWRNDFYLDKPKSERPPKFFISYNIDKWLEAATVPHADGIIAVSQAYCDTFMQRYPSMRAAQFKVIPFGASAHDFEVMRQYITHVDRVVLKKDKINLVYIGRGGHDMRTALEIIFKAFNKGLSELPQLFSKMHFWFIGTSYAPAGQGNKTIEPIAVQYAVADYITEITDRIPYFDTVYLLDKADILIIPGSTDEGYTASKIFPYLLAKKQLLAVFNSASSVVKLLKDLAFNTVVTFNNTEPLDDAIEDCYLHLQAMLSHIDDPVLPEQTAFEPFLAGSRTKEQVDFFNTIISPPKQL
jgi:glycosyltransferase involved in cell wall biosynthesis